jgi:SAM-dependent methyltransferase
MLVNGIDLREIEDRSFDLVAVYSVLHHVPDYLAMVAELARVVRVGGVVYIDHEVNDDFWEPAGCVGSFRTALRAEALARPGWWNPERKRWQRFLVPSRYARRFKLAVNPDWYWGTEGDIHVWEEDHIDWDRIEQRLQASGCEIVRRHDYLSFHAGYSQAVYERFREDCSDMRMLTARRTAGRPARTNAESARSATPAGPS